MDKRHLACGLATLTLVTGTLAASAQVNLLPNGGFEKDTNGDGVPDGWLADPSHFSRETLDQVQTYIADLPSHEELLETDEVRAFDGWPIVRRNEDGNWDGNWDAYMSTPECYRRMSAEYLPENSRFGHLPVPEGLDLGTTTGIVHNLRPHEQLISEPIPVKPNTGYRLSYWFKMSGASEEALFQILGAAGDGVISSIGLGWSWVPYWTHYEIPFRTGPDDTAIRLRPWKYYRGYDDTRRAWYDDFRLIEDDSVVAGEIGSPVRPEPAWPKEDVDRGFVVAARPTLPLTYSDYVPSLDETVQPMTITAAPGQFASKVLFIRALRDMGGPLVVGLKGRPQLNGPQGMYLWAQELVEFRVCHPLKLTRNQQQWEMRPHYLMPGPRLEMIRPETRTMEVTVPEGEGRSVWVTVAVPNGTPPGDYKSAIHLMPPGKDYVGYSDGPGENDGHAIPFTVRVRDLELLEPDVDFGMYRNTMVRAFTHPSAAGAGTYPALADNRRHGMTSVHTGGGPIWVYEDAGGQTRINWSAFDLGMEQMLSAGFRESFHYMPDGDALRPDVQLAILERCRRKGWPEPIFYVHDEPSAKGRPLVDAMEKQFGAARRRGLRTVTSGLDWRTQGEAYDVWIMDVSSVGGKDWPEIQARAAELDAELQAYDCSGYLNTHPRNIRFYTGLWTWAAGLKGNWIWEYADFQDNPSQNDREPPQSMPLYAFVFSLPSGWGASTSWEARREGVDDYRYLHTLESAIAAAAKAGKAAAPAVASARKYLADLKAHVPIAVFGFKVRTSTSLKQFQQLAPDIAPEEYDALQEICASHTIAIRETMR